MEDFLIDPQVIKAESGYKVKVWNREYGVSSSPLLSSIISGGEELLAGPMRVVGTENGNEIAWTDVKNFTMDLNDDGEVRLVQSMQSARFVLNTSMTVFSDGCMDVSLKLASRGRSVNQAFGTEAEDKGDRILSKLWVEIPLKKECAKFYQVLPMGKMTIDGVETDGPFAQAGAVPFKSVDLPFKAQVLLTNDKAGFGVFFESDELWQPEDENKAIQIVVDGDRVLLRLRLLDSEPYPWRVKLNSNGMDAFPLSYRIGMIATPVKAFPENPYTQKNVHIDCFKKIPQDYEDYLFGDYEGGNEAVIDRIKRLGVDTLYIHEKWNDIQNSPELTNTSAERLKLIVREAHKRKIKVIPYFGYEFSTLSPAYAKHGNEFMQYNGERGHWYRKPWQRDISVCYNSGYKEYFIKNIEKLFDEYKIDGLYLDSIMCVTACKNTAHGCGYVDFNGNLKPTYPVWAVRDLMQKLYKIVHEHGGTINSHSYGNFLLPTLAYSDVLWEGESVQALMIKGEMDYVNENYYRSVYTGRNLGVTVNMLCYSNPPIWTSRQATAISLPFGIIPKPNDAGVFLGEMSPLWKVLDGFNFKNSTWNPYYNNDVATDNPNVVVSFYENAKGGLFFVTNMKNHPTGKVKITLPERFKNVTDAMDKKPYSVLPVFEVEFDKFDYMVFTADK